jgi:hypothetical protein
MNWTPMFRRDPVCLMPSDYRRSSPRIVRSYKGDLFAHRRSHRARKFSIGVQFVVLLNAIWSACWKPAVFNSADVFKPVISFWLEVDINFLSFKPRRNYICHFIFNGTFHFR